LAVNNGRSANREPLFLGKPANHAAKRAAGGTAPGIFLTNDARKVIGLVALNDEDGTALTPAQISVSQAEAKLELTKDDIISEWREDLEENPIGDFEFSGHTPPFRNLEIQALTPANSRRQEAISLYADIDGFTKYVDRHVNDNAEDVVRSLHVLRAEMDAVIDADFGGRKIRFIGDCLHGAMAEGTAQTTDAEETVSNAVLCAGGLRSSFNLAIQKLAGTGVDTEGLGLQIGVEYGVITVTRLGMKGDRVRCSVSRSILASELEQGRCAANDTAIGLAAYEVGTQAVRNLFGSSRKVGGLNYDLAVAELASDGDKTAKRAKQESVAAVYSSAAVKSLETPARPYAELPPE
jgi:class 3 adenylate cyclase